MRCKGDGCTFAHTLVDTDRHRFRMEHYLKHIVECEAAGTLVGQTNWMMKTLRAVTLHKNKGSKEKQKDSQLEGKAAARELEVIRAENQKLTTDFGFKAPVKPARLAKRLATLSDEQ